MKELEAIISCKTHGEKARIYRVRASSEGVYQNVTEPPAMQNIKVCDECGERLEVSRA